MTYLGDPEYFNLCPWRVNPMDLLAKVISDLPKRLICFRNNLFLLFSKWLLANGSKLNWPTKYTFVPTLVQAEGADGI